jgi:RNA polymerase sigma-70 factor (ECF subfamily)
VLKDVLGHSLEQTASTMGTTVAGVKAALARARANLAASASPTTIVSADETGNLRRYADLFNARDWDGLRALLGEQARLDIVSRSQRRGSAARSYYSRYTEIVKTEDLRVEVGLADGVPVLAYFRPGSTQPAYFVRLAWRDGRVVDIRDFRYVPYIAEGARFTTL